jgi:hypothetical protein
MPAKALGPLLSALPQAPRDLRVNQRLAALHTRAARFTEAAVCCRTLESIYHDAGYPDEATRYGELAAKYEERGSPEPSLPAAIHAQPKVAVSEASAVATAPEASITEVAATTEEFEIHPVGRESIAPEKEIDLSAEWEDSLSEEPEATSDLREDAVKVAGTPAEADYAGSEGVREAVEEVRFYLSNAMPEEARAAYTKLEGLNPEPSLLSALRNEIEAGSVQASSVDAAAIEEISVADIPAVPEEEVSSVPEPKSAVLDALVSDLESSLGDGFLPQTTAHEVPVEPEPQSHAVELAAAAHHPQHHDGGKLDNFVSDLEASLGDKFLAEAPVVRVEGGSQMRPVPKVEVKPDAVSPKSAAAIPASVAPAQVPAVMAAAASQSSPAHEPLSAPGTFTYHPSPVRPATTQAPAPQLPKFDSGPGVDLSDMFGELKHELEADSAATDEDPETHYNLGVAFREMGLLDEAIGELQKVCQAVERGHSFPHIMQTYTWLSQCFLDKGIPEAAIRWYQKALALPTIDADTRTALHYELATSYQTSGDKASALNHFMEVYGSNIDYRDVAERIKALKS